MTIFNLNEKETEDGERQERDINLKNDDVDKEKNVDCRNIKVNKMKSPSPSRIPYTLVIFTILTAIMLLLVNYRVDNSERRRKMKPKEYLKRQDSKFLQLSATPTLSSKIEVLTPNELFEYDGVKKKKIYIAINYLIFDVSSSKKLYNSSGSYHSLAGIDVSPFLAKNTIPSKLKEPPAKIFSLHQLKGDEITSLTNWYNFFINKYPIVGILKSKSQKEHDSHFSHGGGGGALLKDYDLKKLKKEISGK